MTVEWWHWVVGGIALVLLELVVPAMVLVWFGLGALLVALLVVVVPATALTLQLGVWTLASVGMVLMWFKVFSPHRHKTRTGMSSAAVVGEVGMLVREVEPYARGIVRFQKPILGADQWECIADERIGGGERVRVLSVEGSLLRVGRS